MHQNDLQLIIVKQADIAFICKILHPNDDFDLVRMIKKSVRDYLHTIDGKDIYEKNGYQFDHMDFISRVPNEINRQNGFEVIHTFRPDVYLTKTMDLADCQDFDNFWDTTQNTT